MTNQELTLFSTCIQALSTAPNATEQIQLFIKNFLSNVESTTNTEVSMTQNQSTQVATTPKQIKHHRRGRPPAKNTFRLSPKEIVSMPKKIQKLFAHNDKIIPYRFHKGVFEIYYRREGLYIYASAKDFDEMKRRFIQKLSALESLGTMQNHQKQELTQPANPANNILFIEYIKQWLNTKKVTVKESTYAEYERLCNKDLAVAFGNMPIFNISRNLLQEYLFKYVNEGKLRTAQKLHLILTCIFDLITEDFNVKNPMKKVSLPYYESKKGSAFTVQEERTLVDFCIKNKNNAASSALLVLLYFGLRQSELPSIVIKNETLTCLTSKQLKGRVEVQRSIPFTPMAKQVLQYIDFEKAKETKQRTIASALKRLFPNHHPHELRYTFITRCKECNVNPEVVMLWDGHSFDKDVKTSEVDRGYTDYSEEYLKQEALKVNYSI